jgi:uncharacterized protein YecE (DUF72 family)
MPRLHRERFPAARPNLARYAGGLNAVEINSTFYRPHQAGTLARWAGSVPPGFRFALKMPKAITHEARLAGSREQVEAFIEDLRPMGHKAACLLAQLPPKLEFERRIAARFFSHLRSRFSGFVAVEPRHATWFEPEADGLLVDEGIARVAADPSRGDGGDEPGGWQGFVYYRLHGSPRTYFSCYDSAYIDAIATRLIAHRRSGVPVWCTFDNTGSGSACANALDLVERIAAQSKGRTSTAIVSSPPANQAWPS